MIESEPAVMLMPADEVEIVVRYVDENSAPIDNAAVSFTLIGNAQDSGLSRLTTTTDGAGHATTRLIAGVRAASFQVRVSASGAQPVVVDAAVSDRGFGNLRVTAAYAGKRLVTQRRVLLFAGKSCAEVVSASSPDRQSNLTAVSDEARFIGLPAETRYAVLALGAGAPAIVLAQGCVDDVAIAADSEASVSVALLDFDLSPWGDYTLNVELDTHVVAQELSDHVRNHAMPNAPGVTMTPAQRLLSALEETLRLDPEALPQLAAADALRELRDMGDADAELQAEIEDAQNGPAETQAWLADRLMDELDTVTLTFDLRIEDGPSEPSIAWTLRKAATPSLLAQGGLIEHVIVEPSASMASPDFLWSRDEMTATGGAPAVFGALSVEVIDALIDGGGSLDDTGRQDARNLLGCTQLVAWVQQQPLVQSACDDACVNTACDRTLSALLSSLQTSLVALDVTRSVMTVGATFDLLDTNADADVDELATDACMATWQADPTDVNAVDSYMTGTATGVRVAPAPAP